MANLSVAPFRIGPQAISPAQRFNAVAGNIYTNRIGGARWHLNLEWRNLKPADFAAMRRDIILLLRNPTLASLPTDGTNRAGHLVGGGFIWCDFRRARVHQTTLAAGRTIDSVTGSVVTLNAAVPAAVEPGEYVTLGSELALIQSKAGRTLTVWPRPLQDPTGETVFHATQGLHGGWFEMPGEAPAFVQNPGIVPYGAPMRLQLQGVTG